MYTSYFLILVFSFSIIKTNLPIIVFLGLLLQHQKTIIKANLMSLFAFGQHHQVYIQIPSRSHVNA
jgi:hypothetical protein